jgi:hypothetical protein
LPATNVNPAHELLFQDGHDISQITYIRYHLDGNQLMRETRAYYFDTDPATFVHWNDIDPFGAAQMVVLEDRVIGEYHSQVDFYGSNYVNIDISMFKSGIQLKTKEIIHPRNL